MSKLSSTMKTIVPGVGLALLLVAGTAFGQQEGVAIGEHLDGHGTQQLSGVFRFFLQVVLFVGVVACAGAIWMGICLVFEKGPQQVQQIGWKGPIGGAILGGLMTSIPWVVLSGSQTVTGGGFDDDSWQRLQGGQGSIHQQPSHERVVGVSFTFENPGSEHA